MDRAEEMACELPVAQPTPHPEGETVAQPGLAGREGLGGQGCLLEESGGQLRAAYPPTSCVDHRYSECGQDDRSLPWAWKPHKNAKTPASAPEQRPSLLCAEGREARIVSRNVDRRQLDGDGAGHLILARYLELFWRRRRTGLGRERPA